MFKQSAILITAGLALSAAAQADYQFEVGGAYASGDVSVGSGVDGDQDIITLGGAYYLDSVDTSKGPLGQASFIDRASGIMFTVTDSELEFDSTETELSSYDINGRYVDKGTGWLVQAGYRLDEAEDDSPFGNSSVDTDNWTISAGKYIAETTTVMLGYTFADADDGRESDSYNIDLEHLFILDQGAYKIDAGYGLIDSNYGDDVDVYSLGGTYYVNNNLGFGAAYSLSDSSDLELEEYQLFAEWFVCEQLSLTLGYVDAEVDNTDAESDAVLFGVLGRF